MTRLTPKLHSLMTLVSPKSSKYNISKSNGPIAFNFYTEVKYLKLHQKKLSMTRLTPKKKLSMTRLRPKMHSLSKLVSPKSLKCNIFMNSCHIW